MNDDVVIIEVVFVLLYVTEVRLMFYCKLWLVGVLLAPTCVAICLVLFSVVCDDTIAMTRRTTLTRPDNDSG